MSTIVYGALSRKRADAPVDQSTRSDSPGLRTYADSFSALVPAEALVLLQVLLPAFSEKSTADDTSTITTITDVSAAQFAFWALLAVTLLMYVAGRARSMKLTKTLGSEILRAAIPTAAMAGWVMAEHPELFAAAGFDVTSGMRTVIAAVGAVVLGLAASALGIRADGQQPQSEINGDSPPGDDDELAHVERPHSEDEQEMKA